MLSSCVFSQQRVFYGVFVVSIRVIRYIVCWDVGFHYTHIIVVSVVFQKIMIQSQHEWRLKKQKKYLFCNLILYTVVRIHMMVTGKECVSAEKCGNLRVFSEVDGIDRKLRNDSVFVCGQIVKIALDSIYVMFNVPYILVNVYVYATGICRSSRNSYCHRYATVYVSACKCFDFINLRTLGFINCARLHRGSLSPSVVPRDKVVRRTTKMAT